MLVGLPNSQSGSRPLSPHDDSVRAQQPKSASEQLNEWDTLLNSNQGSQGRYSRLLAVIVNDAFIFGEAEEKGEGHYTVAYDDAIIKQANEVCRNFFQTNRDQFTVADLAKLASLKEAFSSIKSNAWWRGASLKETVKELEKIEDKLKVQERLNTWDRILSGKSGAVQIIPIPREQLVENLNAWNRILSGKSAAVQSIRCDQLVRDILGSKEISGTVKEKAGDEYIVYSNGTIERMNAWCQDFFRDNIGGFNVANIGKLEELHRVVGQIKSNAWWGAADLNKTIEEMKNVIDKLNRKKASSPGGILTVFDEMRVHDRIMELIADYDTAHVADLFKIKAATVNNMSIEKCELLGQQCVYYEDVKQKHIHTFLQNANTQRLHAFLKGYSDEAARKRLRDKPSSDVQGKESVSEEEPEKQGASTQEVAGVPSNKEDWDSCFDILDMLPAKLQHLDLSGLMLWDQALREVISEVFGWNRKGPDFIFNLKELNLQNCQLRSFADLMLAYSRCPKLERLDLSKNPDLSYEECQPTLVYIFGERRLPDLKQLDLRGSTQYLYPALPEEIKNRFHVEVLTETELDPPSSAEGKE